MPIPMTLVGVFGWILDPSMRRPQPKPFRFSHAVNEAGRYETDYGAWQPMTLEGDPPVPPGRSEKRSRRFYDAYVPHIPARAEMARQVLLHWEVIKPDSPLTEPEEWELIEYCLARKGEYANGEDILPKDDYRRFRPRFEAFLIDLGALILVSAQKIKPEAKVVFENEVPDLASPYPNCFPLLVEGNHVVCWPFSRNWHHDVIASEPGERTGLISYTFQNLHTPHHEPTPEEEEAELHEWLDDFVSDNVALPSSDEFSMMMVEARIAYDDVRQSVWDRLGFE